MKKVTIYDPPSGWKYGFPKKVPWSVLNGENGAFKQWLLDEGYPEKDINFALKYGRQWQEKEDGNEGNLT
jgi:hypothetical protein